MIVPEALLVPFPGEAPQGVDLRNPARRPALFDALTELRTARKAEDSIDPPAPPNWTAVERLCRTILTDHSKDMEAAAGLTEAAVHTNGFAGLAAAGAVIAGLAEHFWDGLFPAPEEDEPDITAEDARLRPLNHLVDDRGRLLPAIRRMVLFTLDDGTEFTYTDCQAAKAWTALRPEERAKRPGGGRLWDEIKRAQSQANAADLAAIRDQAAAALVAWQGVAASVGARVEDRGFSCEAVLDLLGDVLRTLTEIVPVQPAAPIGDGAIDQPVPQATTIQPVAATATSPQTVDNREDALRRLDELAAFFRRTEPYSPVAYTLDEAVRRARLPWPEWLAEAVPDRQQRDAILHRLGLRPEAD
jgi:type VI secretion system protein ImpA